MRTPVYTKDGKARIISMPRACQQRGDDPWANVTTKEEALQQLLGKIGE